MARAIIIYGSLTGNTQQIADMLAYVLTQGGVEVDVFEAMDADPEDLLDYDMVLIGSYTYGTHAEIPDELLDYYDVIPELDLTGKPFGTFGSGDDFYPKFATAVDDFEDVLIQAGAVRVGDNIKVNMAPDEPEDIANIKRYGQQLIDAITQA